MPSLLKGQQRLRTALHLCTYGWHRSLLEAEMVARDDKGKVLNSVNLRMCEKHTEQMIKDFSSVPHEVEVQMESGARIGWESDGRAN